MHGKRMALLAGKRSQPGLVRDKRDGRTPGRRLPGQQVRLHPHDLADVPRDLRRREPSSAHVVEPVSRTAGGRHPGRLAVDGAPHGEIVGLPEALRGHDARTRPRLKRPVRAEVQLVPVHLAMEVERGERELRLHDHAGPTRLVCRLRHADVDRVGIGERRQVQRAQERPHAPAYRHDVLAQRRLELARKILLRAEAQQTRERLVPVHDRRRLLQIAFVFSLRAIREVRIRREELSVMVAGEMHAHDALCQAGAPQLGHERTDVGLDRAAPCGRSIRDPWPAVGVLHAHVVVSGHAASARSHDRRAVLQSPDLVGMLDAREIRVGVAGQAEDAERVRRDAQRVLDVARRPCGIEARLGPVPAPLAVPAAHGDGLHHEPYAFVHHRSAGERLQQRVLAERTLAAVCRRHGDLAVHEKPRHAVDLRELRGVVHGIGGDHAVEGVLVHSFRSVVHGRLGLVPACPFRVGRVKVLGRPIAPRRDGRRPGDDDDWEHHAIAPHAVMDVLAVCPARRRVHGCAHLLRPAHGEVACIKLPAPHEVVRGAAHAKERPRVEVVAGRHVHVREQAERQIGRGGEWIRLEDEEPLVVRLFDRQCTVGNRHPPFRAIAPFQRETVSGGEVRLPHDPRRRQFPAVRVDVLPSRRRRGQSSRNQR